MFPGAFDSGNTASVCRVNTESTHALGHRRPTPSGDTCPPCPPRPGQSLGHRRQEAGRPSHRPTASGASPTGASSIAVSTCPRRTPKGSAPSRCSSTPRARWKAESWPRSGRRSTPWLRSSSPIPPSWCRWTRECRTRPSTGSTICPGRPRPRAGAGRTSVRGSRGSRGKASSPTAACTSPIWSATATLPYRRRSLCCGCNWGRGAPPPEHLREP